jgi:hypothetical protein
MLFPPISGLQVPAPFHPGWFERFCVTTANMDRVFPPLNLCVWLACEENKPQWVFVVFGNYEISVAIADISGLDAAQ